MVPAFFGDRFVDKEGCSATNKPSSKKVGDWSEICIKQQENFEVLLKINDQLQIFKHEI
jgi:hypothetical protein